MDSCTISQLNHTSTMLQAFEQYVEDSCCQWI